MLSRLRQAVGPIVAFAIGYLLGGGPVALFLHDLFKMLGVEWSRYQAAGGAGGNFPILIAGFFLGQGLFLLARGVIKALAPARVRYVEEVASWEPGLLLASRFGVQRYLAGCVKWANEDPSARTQSLVFFRIRGLAKLNEALGTLAVTNLLRQIAGELRAAALPDAASKLSRVLAKYAPRRVAIRVGRIPASRCAARWSGAVFALAFRELQPHEVIAVAQDLAAWIRGELAALGDESSGLSVGIGIGSPRGSARDVAGAAHAALAAVDGDTTTVAHDPGDARSGILSQIPHVHHIEFSMSAEDAYGLPPSAAETTFRELMLVWLKRWGPAFGCLAVTPLVLMIRSPRGPLGPAYFPWPDQLKEVPLLGESGASQVKLVRTMLSVASSASWTLSNGKLVQPEAGSQLLRACQVRLTVANVSNSPRYVSGADFWLRDSAGREGRVEMQRQVRLAEGLSGKWLAPGESWSGWLVHTRGDAPVTGVVFRPDSVTRVVANATD
jgi:GGDEF domain-containing protein